MMNNLMDQVNHTTSEVVYSTDRYAHIGGHKASPSSTTTKMYFYEDRIHIGNPDLTISYSAITNIENLDEQKISAGRVIGLGLILSELAIVGAMWKKSISIP